MLLKPTRSSAVTLWETPFLEEMLRGVIIGATRQSIFFFPLARARARERARRENKQQINFPIEIHHRALDRSIDHARSRGTSA